MRIGSLKLKLQIACGDSFAIGPGKADLLEAIDREGSISAAGRALGMSYRRAWLLADEMNRCFLEPVAEASTGGGRDRGTRLTHNGRAMLAAYRALEAEAATIAGSEAYSILARGVAEAPAPKISGTKSG